MQECFIIRRGGTDASITELSEHLKGTIQINGNFESINPIDGQAEIIEIPFDEPDALLASVPLEEPSYNGTILIAHNTTNELVTLYYKKNMEESSYRELLVPERGRTFEITIDGNTYVKDSENNDLTEEGSKVFFLQREPSSQAYFFYKTNLTDYCPITNNLCGVFAYNNRDFLKEEAGANLYYYPYLGRTAVKTNNGKAISFLINALNADATTGNAHIILIGKNQADVEATNTLNGTTYSWQQNQKFSWTWQQNEKTYYMNLYTYNYGNRDPYISYYGISYIPFLGCQKLITLTQDVHCLSNGFNFEIVDRFGYLLEEDS